jgi:hypothetical protein
LEAEHMKTDTQRVMAPIQTWLPPKVLALALVVALAVAALVVVLATSSSSVGDGGSATLHSQPALRSDGGPEEGAVGAAIAPRPSAIPDESVIAASGHRP